MAQRLAGRHARLLNEFGFFTAEQLAEMEAADEASAAEAPEADTGDEE